MGTIQRIHFEKTSFPSLSITIEKGATTDETDYIVWNLSSETCVNHAGASDIEDLYVSMINEKNRPFLFQLRTRNLAKDHDEMSLSFPLQLPSSTYEKEKRRLVQVKEFLNDSIQTLSADDPQRLEEKQRLEDQILDAQKEFVARFTEKLPVIQKEHEEYFIEQMGLLGFRVPEKFSETFFKIIRHGIGPQYEADLEKRVSQELLFEFGRHLSNNKGAGEDKPGLN